MPDSASSSNLKPNDIRVAGLWASGVSVGATAKQLEMSEGNVRRIREKQGVREEMLRLARDFAGELIRKAMGWAEKAGEQLMTLAKEGKKDDFPRINAASTLYKEGMKLAAKAMEAGEEGGEEREAIVQVIVTKKQPRRPEAESDDANSDDDSPSDSGSGDSGDADSNA